MKKSWDDFSQSQPVSCHNYMRDPDPPKPSQLLELWETIIKISIVDLSV